MNIQELQLERDALEKRLNDFIQNEVHQFQEKTGVYAESVSVNLGRYRNYSEKYWRYFVYNVQVDLDI